MLFIHIIVTETLEKDSVVAVIPPEINKRLFSDSIACVYEGINKNLNVFYGTYRLARADNNLLATDTITAHALFKTIEPLKDI